MNSRSLFVTIRLPKRDSNKLNEPTHILMPVHEEGVYARRPRVASRRLDPQKLENAMRAFCIGKET